MERKRKCSPGFVTAPENNARGGGGNTKVRKQQMNAQGEKRAWEKRRRGRIADPLVWNEAGEEGLQGETKFESEFTGEGGEKRKKKKIDALDIERMVAQGGGKRRKRGVCLHYGYHPQKIKKKTIFKILAKGEGCRIFLKML